MSWFENLPKDELHVHLEGAIPHAALWELICKYGGDTSVPDVEAIKRRFEYRNFSHFIRTWSWKNRFLRERHHLPLSTRRESLASIRRNRSMEADGLTGNPP